MRSTLWLAAVCFSVLPAATARGDLVFWTTNSGVYRSTESGSNVTRVTPANADQYRGVAADSATGTLYWAENETSDIWRSDFDGNNRSRLTDLSGQFGMGGLAVDVSGNRLAFSTTNNILKDDLNPGTTGGPQSVLPSNGTSSNGIAIDAAAGHIYWTDLLTDQIRRMNFDGSAVTTLVSGLSDPYDIALDLANNAMYWTESGRIGKASLSGAGVSTFLSDASTTFLSGLALDASNSRLYWIDRFASSIGSEIFTSPTAAANPQLVTTLNEYAYFIDVAAVPEPSSMILLGGALAAVAVAGRRKRRSAASA